MAALTKAAMRAIKMYKHVVQSVEKFILKCKPEYKVPGLYVIDSIVRQSRHQFGPEKDVFAPRFARNIQATFANLFRCSPEDKSRIIRVLNLWQKNNVFAPEIISPLFDLADPNHPIHQQMQQSAGVSMDHSNGHLNTSSGLDSTLNNSGGEEKLTLPDISVRKFSIFFSSYYFKGVLFGISGWFWLIDFVLSETLIEQDKVVKFENSENAC